LAWDERSGASPPQRGWRRGAGIDNFCSWPPSTLGCPMTDRGGYCDPNGDASYTDGDWVRGYYEYAAACS